jgi:hypothetical protein
MQLQVAEVSVAAFALALSSRDGDVRMIGALLRDKAAWRGGSGNGLLESKESRRCLHPDEKNTRARKGANWAELDRDGSTVQYAKVSDNAVVLLRGCPAKELQRDVPGLWRGPASVVGRRVVSTAGLKAMDLDDNVTCGGDG